MRAGAELANRCYYSVGGGFIVSDEVAADGSKQRLIAPDTTVLAHPFHSGADLLALSTGSGLSIAQLMRANEHHWRSDAEIDAGLLNDLARDAGLRRPRLHAPTACCPAASRCAAAPRRCTAT